jgi:hypothetical protein
MLPVRELDELQHGMDMPEKVCLVRVNGLRGWLVSVVATFEGGQGREENKENS